MVESGGFIPTYGAEWLMSLTSRDLTPFSVLPARKRSSCPTLMHAALYPIENKGKVRRINNLRESSRNYFALY